MGRTNFLHAAECASMEPEKGPKLAVLAVQKFVQFRQSGSYKIYISSAGQVEPCKFLFVQKFVQTHVIGA